MKNLSFEFTPVNRDQGFIARIKVFIDQKIFFSELTSITRKSSEDAMADAINAAKEILIEFN